MALKIKSYAFSFVLLALSAGSSFAQGGPISARDNLIFASMNQVEAQQKAMADAMMEAQLMAAESKPASKILRSEGSGLTFREVASHAHPYFLLTTTYDSNIDNRRKDPDGSFINTITPGLKVNFDSQYATLNLDGSTSNKYYNQYPDSNNQNGAASLLANFLINRYTLAISDSYNNNYGPARVAASDDSTFDNTLQWNNGFMASLSRQYNRLGFNLSYNRADYQYRGAAASENNYYQSIYDITQNFTLTKKTEFSLGYQFSNAKYRHDAAISNDYYYNQFQFSLTKILTAKITGLLSTAYKKVDYQDKADYKEGIYGINFSYQPTMRTSVSLNYQFTPHDSSSPSDYSISNDILFSMTHRPAFSSKVQFTLSYEAMYLNSAKQIDPGYNNTFTFNCGLNYYFRQWLDFSLHYSNKRTAGSLATKYNDNIVTLQTQARF